MKDLFVLLICQVPSIACVSIAGALAYRGTAGWGWFLFAALCLFVTWSSKKTG